MSLRKRSLAQHLQNEMASFAHHADGGAAAGVPITVNAPIPQAGVYSAGVNAKLAGANYAAQFDLTARVVYSKTEMILSNLANFTNVTGYTPPAFSQGLPFSKGAAVSEVSFNDLRENLKNELPVYLFGNADFASGFKTIASYMPVINWRRGIPKIVKQQGDSHSFNVDPLSGGGEIFHIPSLALANGKAQIGDLIIPFIDVVVTPYDGGLGNEIYRYQITMAEVVLTCKQVAYGTLLDAINSDRFVIDRIRYRVPEGQSAQFENQILLIKQSLFGKTSNDFVSPTSFVKPEQFQSNIVDIPLEKGIDKESIMGISLNPNVGEIVLSMFVPVKNSLVQNV